MNSSPPGHRRPARKKAKPAPAPDPGNDPETAARRTDSMADGLRAARREGDITGKEYIRQVQEIAQEEREES